MVRFKSPVISAIVSAAVTASVVGGVAVAQSSSDMEIIGCVAENSGNVRIVASAGDCKHNEAAMRWNQQGPPGPQGEQGPAGPAGNLALAGQVCPSGQFVVGFSAAGDIVCGAPGTATGGDGSPDADGDGFRVVDGDCNDSDPAINPGAVEVADGVDNNCNGSTDEGLIDSDGDGFTATDVVGDGNDCDDSRADIYPGAPELADDELDNDCDGLVDEVT